MLNSSAKNKNSEIIKQKAMELGFMACGISKAEFLEEEAPRLEKWLSENRNGEMKYMENYFDKRLDPRILFEGCKSVISVLVNYFPSETQQDPEAPKLSKYAYGEDYHFVIKRKLNELLLFIQSEIGEVEGRIFVDSAPVMDKAWAKKSGLGWIGKNSNLITNKSGSFFFIGELMLDAELQYDTAIGDYCGTCTRCLDACPTGAIIQPYVVDGSKCISYFTIELKDAIPVPMKGQFDNWMFGCDICQEVCPWNRFSKPHTEAAFLPHPDLLEMTKQQWKNISKETFDILFKKSAVKRTKFKGLKRNIDFLE
ncbi:MAG: tRNA epoxyqueuosine(34) reductase QueG [Bacteroidetes bacterium]|nr:tRNA epoxyqueuosine(34) reductase QueG [Bacteroidota bacterium]